MIIRKTKAQLSSPFIQNVGWLGIAELVSRVFRLGTTVTLARFLDPYDYGLMALIYTTQSFTDVLSSGSGIGSKIIQVDEANLAATCNTAYWMNWIVCLSMVVLQCAIAYPVAVLFGEPRLALPICVASLKYAAIPIFKVQGSLIQRENRLKITALSQTVQAILSNVITVILILLGAGIWAIVWAMVFSVAGHIVINYRYHPWRPPNFFDLHRWREVTSFGISILGVRLLDKLRLSLDYLIVGQFLGVEALGLYYFAFNAGIGISQNLINAFTKSLFPYLCAAQKDSQLLRHRFRKSLTTMMLIVVPFVLLQSGSASLYVPIVFGPKWVPAVAILSIICLSAIPLAISQATYELLNAVGKTKLNLYWNIGYTVLFGAALLVAVQWGIQEVAIAVLACQISALLFCIYAVNRSFPKASIK